MTTVTHDFTNVASGDDLGLDGIQLDTGETWALHPTHVGDLRGSGVDTVRPQATSPYGLIVSDWLPASADCRVEASIRCVTATTTSDRGPGIAARFHATNSELVQFRYELSANNWEIIERIAGVDNVRGSHSGTPHDTAGVTIRAALEVVGTTAKGYLDTGSGWVEVLSVTLTTLTAAGRVGFRGRGQSASNTADYHFEDFLATDELGGGGTTVDLTPATETDVAQPLTYSQAGTYSINPATETDAAQALAARKTVTITPATETDLALGTVTRHEVDLSPALETDTAQPLTTGQAQQKTITPAVETGTAQPLTATKRLSIGPATETDQAQALSAAQAQQKTISPAAETDEAQPLSVTHIHYRTIGPATETDTARPLGFTQPGGPVTLGIATEDDVAQALTFTKTIYKAIAPALEVDDALALDITQRNVVTIDPATETDAAQALTVTHVHYRTLTPVAETDVAQALVRQSHQIPVTITLAAELEHTLTLEAALAHTLTLEADLT